MCAFNFSLYTFCLPLTMFSNSRRTICTIGYSIPGTDNFLSDAWLLSIYVSFLKSYMGLPYVLLH